MNPGSDGGEQDERDHQRADAERRADVGDAGTSAPHPLADVRGGSRNAVTT